MAKFTVPTDVGIETAGRPDDIPSLSFALL